LPLGVAAVLLGVLGVGACLYGRTFTVYSGV
jgi:hypothetical protein